MAEAPDAPMPSNSRVPSLARVADYIFGRNALIGFASLMLLAISGYATWSGMSDFIIGVSTSDVANAPRVGPAGLSVSNEFLVIAVVVALTFLMWLALRETFGAGRTLKERLITAPLYIFLALWSIGFGYGFWWSLIAGEEATRTSLSGLQEDARDAGNAVAARLDAMRIQLDNVVTWSDSQMQREESSGGSCGKPSGAGRGPLYNARLGVREAVASLRTSINNSWLQPIQSDVAELQATAANLGGDTLAERQQNFESKAANVRGTARSIAARSNEFGQSTAAEMNALAQVVLIQPGKAGFSCYDPTLAQRLRQAAAQAGQPATLDLRDAQFNEGPAGVANAVKNLWSNIGSFFGGTARYVASGFQDAGDDGGRGITGRDLIALLATIGVDLGLFALTALNPPMNRPTRHVPSAKTIRQVREAVNTAIARVPDDDVNYEWVRRHLIHHHGKSYFVAPNLYAAQREGGQHENEPERALAINQLTGVLDDLGLIRWPDTKEIQRLRDEESEDSLTDLSLVRKERLKKLEARKEKGEAFDLDKEKADEIRSVEPLRNHGLFSKAERALKIAGWSELALRDIEIFPMVDTEGLTPLLTVLNEPMDRDGEVTESSAG